MTRSERLGALLLPITLLGLLLFPLAVAGFRWQLWGFGTAFLIMQGQVVLSLATLLLAAVLILLARRQHERAQASRGGWIALMMVLVVALYAVQVHKAKTVPFIHDVTTDTRNPPVFEAVASLRGPGDHGVDYGGEAVASQQRVGYPDLLPLTTDSDPEQAYIRLKAMVQAKGWELVADEPERGHLEAVVTSTLFGFKDDLVIRVQPQGEGARIDMRSASRIGRSDLGANAARLRALREGFAQ
ncbi:DUF1499 domain-containing protein [Aestuariirhabdus litorea]|uniref:DUF1499 domain-containing protein n=1 Tax=Aestuariirhabdus litorea TaxID=2528527 RepID=A0A3P3VP03_9GAMM|nr:DUF1499 domain-containing protein [Aestuariirhabdus litorea]RRJ83439.1 DUF1499 domain-containing protein [Aestuariirhabdus litorea]RWW93601.1 DUF1499 domain-containing protein [Endozoicomonadaceae bacterium GTF-13]